MGSGGGSASPQGVSGLFGAEKLRCFGQYLLTILSFFGVPLNKGSEFTLSGAQEDEFLRLFGAWDVRMLMIAVFEAVCFFIVLARLPLRPMCL